MAHVIPPKLEYKHIYVTFTLLPRVTFYSEEAILSMCDYKFARWRYSDTAKMYADTKEYHSKVVRHSKARPKIVLQKKKKKKKKKKKRKRKETRLPCWISVVGVTSLVHLSYKQATYLSCQKLSFKHSQILISAVCLWF